ncbi:MAG: hypothetical protein ABIT01_03620, partial [Thermoanaerobaculia bacterium]
MKNFFSPGRFALIGLALLAVAVPHGALLGALTVTPITWNVIGLDSNNVNTGPNQFPVGIRVTNTGPGAATNITATFVWDTANANINLRTGSLNPITFASLASGASRDFYFEVVVTRTVAAYNTTRNYHIAVTADGGLAANSPTPRQLYVEKLISQSRNSFTAMYYGPPGGPLTQVLPGGIFALNPGGTYDIKIDVSTATAGYEQIESFINFQNTVFQINSVNTTYTATSGVDLTRLYGDGCGWVNDPNDPAYRSCTGTGKNGGTMTITYNVTILSVPSTNPDPLSVLIYDFSGSSYHYNGNYGSGTTSIYIVDPTAQTISKAFAPNPAAPGGVTSLTFTIGNPTPA